MRKIIFILLLFISLKTEAQHYVVRTIPTSWDSVSLRNWQNIPSLLNAKVDSIALNGSGDSIIYWIATRRHAIIKGGTGGADANAIYRDGSQPPTANTTWNAKRITHLANAVSDSDAVNLLQTQNYFSTAETYTDALRVDVDNADGALQLQVNNRVDSIYKNSTNDSIVWTINGRRHAVKDSVGSGAAAIERGVTPITSGLASGVLYQNSTTNNIDEESDFTYDEVGGIALGLPGGGGSTGSVIMWTNEGGYVKINPDPTQATSWTMTVPTSEGAEGQALITDGTGITSWGYSPINTFTTIEGITSGDFLYNNAGTLGGVTNIDTTKTPNVITKIYRKQASDSVFVYKNGVKSFAFRDSIGTGTVTSTSFTGGLISVANPTTTPALTVAGTSGGVPYFSSSSTWASSGALAANSVVIGGGAGAAPSTTTTGTGMLTWFGTPSSANLASTLTDETGSGLAVFSTSPSFTTPVLGTPTSGTLTNCTGPWYTLASGGTATGTNTFTMGSNPLIISTGVTTGGGATAGLQVAANSLTTGNGIDASSSSITTGNLMKLTSTSTAANGFSLMNILSSGSNGSSSRTATGQTISISNSGTTSTNVGLSVAASGATNNYALVVPASSGFVGIGTTTPAYILDILHTQNAASRFQFQNLNSGSAAQVLWQLGNDASNSLQLGITSSGFTSTPGECFVQSNAGLLRLSALGSNIIKFMTNNSERWRMNSTGLLSNTAADGTAYITLKAGTTSASTAPIKLTSGSLMTNAEVGAIEFLTDDLYFTGTTSTTRYKVDKALTGSATLNFASIAVEASDTLGMMVTGAASGDVVAIGVGAAAWKLNMVYTGYCIATNWVVIQATNNNAAGGAAIDPGSATFKVRVIR